MFSPWLKTAGFAVQNTPPLVPSTTTRQVASDTLGNLTRDVGMGIEEGTVAALISRSLEGPGDADADDDVISTSYVAPGVLPSCIAEHGREGDSPAPEEIFEVRQNRSRAVDERRPYPP